MIENKETKEAEFALKYFKFTHFEFTDIYQDEIDHPMSIGFIPRGMFNESTKMYDLVLQVLITDGNDKDKNMIKATLLAGFQFKNVGSIETLPSYFYRNSIAIIFPYVRSFISTITMQANVETIVLPLMNLSGLEPTLRENTAVFVEQAKTKADTSIMKTKKGRRS